MGRTEAVHAHPCKWGGSVVFMRTLLPHALEYRAFVQNPDGGLLAAPRFIRIEPSIDNVTASIARDPFGFGQMLGAFVHGVARPMQAGPLTVARIAGLLGDDALQVGSEVTVP